MLLKMALDRFAAKGVKQVVCDRSLSLSEEHLSCALQFHFMTDVRSAAFFACGISQRAQEAVVLLVRLSYLSSAFTGITEAFFQRRPVFVVAVGDGILNRDVSYYKHCTALRYRAQKEAELDSFFASDLPQDSPSLLLIEEKNEEEKKAISADLSPVLSLMSQEDLLMLSPYLCFDGSDARLYRTSLEDGYGQISKYMGFCVARSAKTVLAAPYSVLDLDMNIINNRYLASGLKMILFCDGSSDRDAWMGANGIRVHRAEALSAECAKMLLESDDPFVLVIGKEGGEA